MPAKQEIATFIRSTFRSVWALELLCFLRQNRDRSLTPGGDGGGPEGERSGGHAERRIAGGGGPRPGRARTARRATARPPTSSTSWSSAPRRSTRSSPDAVRRMIVAGRQSGPHRLRRRVPAEEGLRRWRVCFPAAVYLLCFLTSGACALLLARSYRRHRHAAAAVERALLPVPRRQQSASSSSICSCCRTGTSGWRGTLLALAAVGVLLFGFIWDLED